MNALKEIFVDVYQKIDCLDVPDLDDAMAIVAKEPMIEKTCEKISGLRHGELGGAKVLPAIFRACNDFYSAIASREKIHVNKHYISLDGSATDPDVIDARTIDVDKVHLIILNLDDFILEGRREIDGIGMLKKIIYLMIYVDVKINDKKVNIEEIHRMVNDLPVELITEAIGKNIQ